MTAQPHDPQPLVFVLFTDVAMLTYLILLVSIYKTNKKEKIESILLKKLIKVFQKMSRNLRKLC
ncbi:MAG: hypothetical protein EBY39_08165 [Flavobacteriia bacterium]|nr:hypothetical protein [Flavobacteriia bacterium]